MHTILFRWKCGLQTYDSTLAFVREGDLRPIVVTSGASTLARLRESLRAEMAVWGNAIQVIGLKPE